MTAPNKPKPPGKPGRKNKKSPHQKGQSAFAREVVQRMEKCQTAEALNDQVITPFIQALVDVCDARGYVLNIYGEHCNLAITPEDHAESLFHLIEDYLNEAALG